MPKRPPSFNVESLDDGLDYEVDLAASGGEDNYETGPQPTANGDAKKTAKEKKKLNKKPRLSYFSDPAVAFGTPEAQASFMNHKLRHAFKGISQLELEGASFKSSYFIDSSDFVNPRTPSVLPDWFGKYGNVTFGGSRVKVAKGTPKVLIITCHANRATELIRESRKLAPKVQVAKLFARHMKIEEQRKLLKKFHTDVAVGTPNRILKLMEDPASLTLGRTELIILDCFRDGKDRMVVDMPDCSQDLFILFRQFFLPQLDAGKLRVGMF